MPENPNVASAAKPAKSELSLEDLFDDIAAKSASKGGKEGQGVDAGLQLRLLRDSWAALNRWITATMRARKGVHIPNLCRMTWEVLEGNATEVRVRPVFMLTDTFIRGLQLPLYKKPVLPANCAPCEELNLSQVAIKHSESLTKDVLFVALRDIVRKVTECVAAGRSLDLALDVGKFKAKGRRVWFEFDGKAFLELGGQVMQIAPQQMDAPQISVRDTPVVSPPASQPVTVPPIALPRNQEQRLPTPSQPDARSEARPDASAQFSRSGGQSAASMDEYNEGDDDEYEGGNDFAYDDEELKRALVGGGSSGGDLCLESAFTRYIGELEAEARATEAMEAAIHNRLTEVYGASDARRKEHKAQVLKTHAEVKMQMAAKALERDQEAKAKMRPNADLASGSVPILTRDAGVAQVLGSTPPPPEVDESTLSPRSLMVHRMRNKITDGGLRGKGVGPLSRSQLLASLEGQIGAKESLVRSKKEAELTEERRYLEHVKAEMHLHSTYAKAAELSKQRDLLAAWERDGHLKNLAKLKALGPTAMRDYLADALLGQQAPALQGAKGSLKGPLDSARRSGMGPSAMKLAKDRQAEAVRSGAMSGGMSDRLSSRPGTGTVAASVGFDPRA